MLCAKRDGTEGKFFKADTSIQGSSNVVPRVRSWCRKRRIVWKGFFNEANDILEIFNLAEVCRVIRLGKKALLAVLEGNTDADQSPSHSVRHHHPVPHPISSLGYGSSFQVGCLLPAWGSPTLPPLSSSKIPLNLCQISFRTSRPFPWSLRRCELWPRGCLKPQVPSPPCFLCSSHPDPLAVPPQTR